MYPSMINFLFLASLAAPLASASPKQLGDSFIPHVERSAVVEYTSANCEGQPLREQVAPYPDWRPKPLGPAQLPDPVQDWLLLANIDKQTKSFRLSIDSTKSIDTQLAYHFLGTVEKCRSPDETPPTKAPSKYETYGYTETSMQVIEENSCYSVERDALQGSVGCLELIRRVGPGSRGLAKSSPPPSTSDGLRRVAVSSALSIWFIMYIVLYWLVL